MTRSGEAMEQTGTLGPGRAVNQHATPELLVDDADQPATASKATAKIMLVDEEELNIEILQAFLQEVGYANFVSTSEPREAIDLMTNERPDVVLLDLGQSQVCAFDIVSRMQQDSVLKHVPVIMLTAAADASTKLAALKLGVTDFLAKPVDPSELLLRLRNTLTAKAYLDQLAYCDTLTGLANRERFHDRLDWTIRFSRRYGTTGAVLQIGLDRFMQVNDALGPGVGDRLLRAVAMRLERSLRDSDVLAHTASDATSTVLSRIGGDEFTVLLPALATVAGAGEVAQRVLDIVAAPFNIAGIELFVTCCVGIALFPADGTARDTVLKAASIAMRHAKSEGRNRFRFFSKTLNARSLHRLSLEGQLRKALERDELELFYQPKVELESARLVGAEALVRWRHPERGLVSPGEFIALAEESGLIIPLGSWVLRAACSQIREWRDAGHKLPRISVNVSSHQFKQRDLPRHVQSVISETRINGEGLCLELTESAVMEQAHESIQTLDELKSSGVALSIDDFGTGHSSLSYLKRFPIDELKIDRSFVIDVDRDEDNAAIVTAVVAMAHSLGFRVVAEGVETIEQLRFLARKGCDECQGFLFGRPLPAAEFGALLGREGLPVLPMRSTVLAR